MKCGIPNAFDVSPIYDGVLGRPIYKEELLENNTAENPYKLITKVGDVPTHLMDKELVINIILIFDNCACEYVIPLKVNSKTIDLFPLIPKLSIPNNNRLTNKGILYSNEIEFEFDKNKITPRNNDYYSLYNDIHSIQIYSYSSVEGNESLNNKLHNERAKTIENFAKDSLQINIKPSLVLAKENWEKCMLQLAMENNDEILTKSKNEIRKYINNNVIEWNEYLYQQRVSKLVVNYQGELLNNDSIGALFYDPSTRVQIRINGKAILHFNNEMTSEAWQKTTLSSRRCYLTQASPSSFSAIPTSGLTENIEQEKFTLAESEAGAKYFGIVSIQVESMEWLWLNHAGHRRAFFDYINNNNSWMIP